MKMLKASFQKLILMTVAGLILSACATTSVEKTDEESDSQARTPATFMNRH